MKCGEGWVERGGRNVECRVCSLECGGWRLVGGARMAWNVMFAVYGVKL